MVDILVVVGASAFMLSWAVYAFYQGLYAIGFALTLIGLAHLLVGGITGGWFA